MTDFDNEQNDDQPVSAALLAYVHATTARDGLAAGAPVNVPDGYLGFMLANGKPYDVVSPGDYLIDERSFPLVARKYGTNFSSSGSKPTMLEFLLLNVTGAVKQWRTHEIPLHSERGGINYCRAYGNCVSRIVDPMRFWKEYLRGWKTMIRSQKGTMLAAFKGMDLEKRLNAFVNFTINTSMDKVLSKSRIRAEKLTSSIRELNSLAFSEMTKTFQKIGLDCSTFEITDPLVLRRPPCATCGSRTKPTGYGAYNRIIGLIHFHWIKREAGNFCVPCAAKLSAGSNLIILLAGWWSIGGIILSPIYLIANCYYFLSTAFGPKASVVQVEGE